MVANGNASVHVVTTVVLLQNFPPDANRIITITGKADAVERAVKMVQDLMTGDPGTAQQVIQKVLGTVSSTCWQPQGSRTVSFSYSSWG
jgi:hypothetical protein